MTGQGTQERTTIREAARTLRVTEKSIQRYLAKGLLTKIKEGRNTFVLVSELKLIADMKADSPGQPLLRSRGETPRNAYSTDLVTVARERFENLLIELGELRNQVQVLLRQESALLEKEVALKDAEEELERTRSKLRILEDRDRERDKELNVANERIRTLEAEPQTARTLKPWWQR